MSKPTLYAIDFGTSNSLLAAASKDRVFPPVPIDELAPDPTIKRSALYFLSHEEASFGAGATQALVRNGFRGRLIRSIKRHLSSRSFTKTQIGSRQLSLEDIVGAFLRVMRKSANEHFDTDVTAVVLGRPARFSQNDEDDALAERRLGDAARIAGFTSVTFCPEPVAAAYDFAADLEEKRNVMIADLGGGTSDFTMVRMKRSGFDQEDVLATHGVTVAGDAMDGALMRRVGAPHFGSRARYMVPFGHNELSMPKKLIELLASPADLTLVDRTKILAELAAIRDGLTTKEARPLLERFIALVEDGLGFPLYEAVELGKRGLSFAEQANIDVTDPSIAFTEQINRPLLAAITEAEVASIVDAMNETLARSGVARDDVDILCLTGGTSQMPLVANALLASLPNAKPRRMSSFHSVVLGLARHARELAG